MAFQQLTFKKTGIVAVVTLLTGVLVFLIYSNTMNAPFHFDDMQNIRNNPDIRITDLSFKSIYEVGAESLISSRPVPNISFALNYYFGGYNVFGYHIVNVIIHLLTGLFFFLLVKDTLCIVREKSQSLLVTDMTEPAGLAFAVALIWLLHPLATQSVTYIVQRMTSMATLFSVISMFCYVKARLVSIQWKQWALYASCAASWLLALGSKEISATLPFFVFLYEWYFFKDMDPEWMRKRILFLAGLAVIGIILAIFFLGTDPIHKILGGYRTRDFTLGQRIMTEWRIVMMYLGLIFFPYPGRLNLDYDFPLSYSFLNPMTTLISLLSILGLIVFAVWVAKRDRIISFAILWFFGNLVIESSVIGLELVYEHRTYIPSMFVVFAAVLAVHYFLKNRWFRVAALCFVVGLFSFWTYQRNLVWADELTLWTDILKKSPYKARPHVNLGLALFELGEIDGAIEQFNRALEIDPKEARPYNNLGLTLLYLGEIDGAIKQFEKALEINPDMYGVYNNMGNALAKKNRFDEAVSFYNKALAMAEKADKKLDVMTYHVSLGSALEKQGKISEAIEQYRQTLSIDPNFDKAHNHLGKALAGQGIYDEAVYHFSEAIRVNPTYAEAYNNLANTFVQMGMIEKGIEYYKESISTDPGYIDPYTNLGMLFYKRGELDKAIEQFREIIRIDPENEEARENLTAGMKRRDAVNTAIAKVENALKQNPRDHQLLYQLGELYRMKGSFTEAIKNYEKALSILPGFPRALRQAAVVYSLAGDKDKAISYLKKAVELNPDDPGGYYNISCMYSLAGNVDEAVFWLKKAVEKGFDDWELVSEDPDLNNIRKTEDYEKLLQERREK